MATREPPTPDLRICGNCRAFTAQGSRCAEIASPDFDRAVEPLSGCAQFHIGFAAAKQLACGTRDAMRPSLPDEPWAENMHRHLAARSRSAMHS